MNKNVVLITGGTGAIGEAMCREFHSQGYQVVANCHSADLERSQQLVRSLATEGVPVVLSEFDVTDACACETAVEHIESTVGEIVVLVNAAGITRDAKLIKLDPEQWHSVLRTNLDGVYNVTRQCIGPMSARRFGRVINISSVNGQRGQIGQTNYSAAKAITVNSVSPGYVRSPMIAAVPEKVQEKIIQDIPVGRFAEPMEIARAVSFLAHADSGYITGTDLSVNGGYHIA